MKGLKCLKYKVNTVKLDLPKAGTSLDGHSEVAGIVDKSQQEYGKILLSETFGVALTS